MLFVGLVVIRGSRCLRLCLVSCPTVLELNSVLCIPDPLGSIADASRCSQIVHLAWRPHIAPAYRQLS